MTHFTVVKNALVPRDEDAHKLMAKQKVGDVVEVQLLHLQDAAFRRYVFLVINKVAAALNVDPSEMRARLLLETGRFRMIRLSDGRIVAAVQSMNRNSMGNEELHSFFSEVKNLLYTTIMPTLDPIAVSSIDEVLNTGGPA